MMIVRLFLYTTTGDQEKPNCDEQRPSSRNIAHAVGDLNEGSAPSTGILLARAPRLWAVHRLVRVHRLRGFPLLRCRESSWLVPSNGRHGLVCVRSRRSGTGGWAHAARR